MNPSSVLSGSTGNSRMSLDPELRLHLAGCMKEIFSTAPKVLGRPWPEKLAKVDADKILKSSERNSEGLPSMLVDWQAGRPMELEVILGNPVRSRRGKEEQGGGKLTLGAHFRRFASPEPKGSKCPVFNRSTLSSRWPPFAATRTNPKPSCSSLALLRTLL